MVPTFVVMDMLSFVSSQITEMPKSHNFTLPARSMMNVNDW